MLYSYGKTCFQFNNLQEQLHYNAIINTFSEILPDKIDLEPYALKCSQMDPIKKACLKRFGHILQTPPPSKYPYVRINLRPDSPHELVLMASDIIRDQTYIKLGLPLKPTEVFAFS